MNTLLQASSSSISPWMPAYVLVAGFALTGIARLVGRRHERSSNRKLFISNIRSILADIPVEMGRLQQRVTTLTPEAGMPAYLLYPGFHQLNVFRDMTYRQVFNAFFTGIENYFNWSGKLAAGQEKLKRFNQMWAFINALEIYTQQMNQTVEAGDIGIAQAILALNAELEEMDKVISDLLAKEHPGAAQFTRQQAAFHQQLEMVLEDFYKQRPSVRSALLFYTYKNYILPLRD